jgi:hypothetical protein
MIQRRQQPGFPIEAGDTIRIGVQALRQNFDGDVATKPLVPRLIHLPHAALSKRLNNLKL